MTFNAQSIVVVTAENYFYRQTGMKLITTGEYLPVDTSANYELSGMLKTVNATQSKAYLALIPYDRDKNYIHPQNVVRYGGPVTVDRTITATQIPVANGSDFTGWQASTAMAYMRSIGIYYDGDTGKLPDYVHRYTPGSNSSTDPSHGAYSQASGTSITLNTALPTEVLNQIQSGVTAVMNHGSGDSYIYTTADDQWVPNTWIQYRGSLSGEQWGVGTDNFRKGTAFVQVAVLADWTNSGATLFMDEIHFTKVSDTYVTNSNPIGSDPAQIVQKPWTDRILLAASDTGPYGLQFREIHNTPGTEPHLFTGQEREPELGLYYMGGRWKVSDDGRFLQVDPAREFWNNYSYTGNYPINFSDPTGECVSCFVAFRDLSARIAASEAVKQDFQSKPPVYIHLEGLPDVSPNELRAINSGVPINYILLARQTTSRKESDGMDVFEVTSDGFGNEIGRYNIGLRNGINLALGIVTQRFLSRNAFSPQTNADRVTQSKADWKLGSFKKDSKWQNQMEKRGWTNDQISYAIDKGKRYSIENLVNKGNSAARYVHPVTGRSVVVDDVTKEVIHVGGNGFRY